MTTTDSTAAPKPGLFAFIWAKVKEYNRNIWGSDATVAYSAEYTWLSNQMSHAMMGFFLASVWILLLWHWEEDHGDQATRFAKSWWAPWLPLIIPVLKDLIDYALDAWLRPGKFRVNKAELRLDWVTDEFFWWFGMVLAIVLLHDPFESFWPSVAVTVVVGVAGMYLFISRLWVPQKRLFDASRMPFNFLRLIKYANPERLLGPAEMDKVSDFQDFAGRRETDGAGRHYVLVGGRPVDRSRLAVSMGCEYISSWKGVYMTSATKFMEDPAALKEECLMPAGLRAKVSLLIVDDVNVNLPIPSGQPAQRQAQKASVQAAQPKDASNRSLEQVGASIAEKVIEFVDQVAALRQQFQHISTIWVLSAEDTPDGRDRVQAWKAFIEELVTGARPNGSLVTIQLNRVAPC